MQTIVIANPKGGSGKTTLATNIAGWLAGKRQRVVLADADPQHSSTQWLQRRPPLFPAIVGHNGDGKKKDLKDFDPQWAVVDTAAGSHGESLRDAVRRADVMLVPLAASTFDMAATQRFLATLAEYKAVRQGALALGIVANRVDARTRAAGELDEFLKSFDFPVIAHLRDTAGATSIMLHYPPWYGVEKALASLELFAREVAPKFKMGAPARMRA